MKERQPEAFENWQEAAAKAYAFDLIVDMLKSKKSSSESVRLAKVQAIISAVLFSHSDERRPLVH